MIIGLPRSGTTWASNWLSTQGAHCEHDPLYTSHYSDWDRQADEMRDDPADFPVGVSCTGIWRWPLWVNAHPARKVILHRNAAEVQNSLTQQGLELPIDERHAEQLWDIEGLHVPWCDLFDPVKAEAIWQHLVDDEFDPARHEQLAAIQMQPNVAALTIDFPLQQRLWAELGIRVSTFY